MRPRVTGPELMTPIEVYTLWRVNPRTLSRWRQKGRISAVVTPGGTHRYFAAEVEALLSGSKTRRQVPGGGPS